MYHRLLSFLKKLITDTNSTFITLLKIMVPAIIIIKVLEMVGAVTWLGEVLDPAMSLLGLPGEAGLVWATCVLGNIFAALVIFFTQVDYGALNVMQVTILGSMMLIAHALIIEGAIAKKTGLSWRLTLLLRIVGAIVFGWLIKITCTYFGMLQETVVLNYIPESSVNQTFFEWVLGQLYGLLLVYFILMGLIGLIKFMNRSGLNTFLERLMAPVLHKIGIGERAASMTLIGMTLGLTYGGGLLIHESKKETISKRDIFLSICLISLCHSLIEDTLIIMLMGVNFSVIVFFRLLYSLMVVFVIDRVTRG